MQPRKKGVLHVLRDFARDTSGSYVVLSALAMPVLIGAAALGTEVGYWMHQQQKMQDAADSAAFASATYYGPNPTATAGTSSAATSVAAAYGFTNTTNSSGSTTGNSTLTVSEPPADGPSKGRTGAVEVQITRSYPRMLSALFGKTPVVITARAVAKTKGGYGCVLALDPTVSNAAQAQGSINVQLLSCSLYDNSDSSAALQGGGAALLTALSVGVVGGVAGATNFSTTEGIWTGQPATPDPYSDVNVPSFSGCDYHNYNTKKNDTLNPGVYCGGIHFNGGTTATLTDGTYIFDGGSFLVDGGATVTCNHCTLVFTSSTGKNYPNVTINGGATMNLAPPNSGTLSGLVMYADRNTPVGTNFKLDGGSAQVLGGAVYIPTGAIDYGGGNNTQTVCTQLIGDTVTFSANAYLAVNCTGMGVRMWGTGARLSE
ncbi:MAG TPA: pilus assembly protein TadG-related protein [Rhizomicrobium sp.]|jgi:Flp pilus assembly protein TadG|nr:pilus assembly protein TadG-related protein [Rhizomicrobium sp.]